MTESEALGLILAAYVAVAVVLPVEVLEDTAVGRLMAALWRQIRRPFDWLAGKVTRR